MKKLIPKFFQLLSILSPYLAAKLALKLFSHPRRKPRSDEEMEFLATGKQITFQSQRKARTWGKGPVVWLLHGWESRGSTFYKLIPLLVDKDYQVIAWDGPAHGDSPGDSTHVPDYAKSLSIDMNENLFNEPIAILGHSFGGAALAILAKIHKMPAKVIIASSPARVAGVFSRFTKMIKLGKKATLRFISLSENDTGYTLNGASLISNDISKTSDVLVIHDKGDDVIPFEDFKVLKDTWQSGQFIATENLGHRLTIKDPEILKTIVGFITDDTNHYEPETVIKKTE